MIGALVIYFVAGFVIAVIASLLGFVLSIVTGGDEGAHSFLTDWRFYLGFLAVWFCWPLIVAYFAVCAWWSRNS